MKNLLGEYPLDSLITTDEWDSMRYLIDEQLKACEIKGDLNSAKLPLPFILLFEGKIKDKLIKAGFDKEALDNPGELELILKELNKQGRKYVHPIWRDNPPQGFPTGSFTLSSDKRIFWVKPDIEAALLALESITIIKRLLINNGLWNKEAVKVYLRSLELTINLSRAGIAPELARAGQKYSNTQSNKRGKRRRWKGLTPEMRQKRNESIIEHFKKTSNENKQMTLHSFALRHAGEHNLQPTQFKKIIKSSLDT